MEEINKALRHFGGNIDKVSRKIKKYADEILGNYLFTWTEDKKQYGYCTHCKKTFKITEKYRHREQCMCSKCLSEVTVIKTRYKSKDMLETVRFIYYEKSKVDKNVIVARAIYALRMYGTDYKKAKTEYYTEAGYIFKIGEALMIRKGFYNSYYINNKVTGPDYATGMVNYNWYENLNNISEAFSGTNMKYWYMGISQWWCSSTERLKLIALHCKYPLVESLLKIGLEDIIKDRIRGGCKLSCINWRGSTVFEMLRLTKGELKEMKSQRVHITCEWLAFYQLARKTGSSKTIGELANIDRKIMYDSKRIKEIAQYLKFDRIISYVNKQFKIQSKISEEYTHTWYSVSEVIGNWIDYIKDLKKLGMDINDKDLLCPKDLYKQHQNTIKQIEVKENREMNKKIKKRAESLKKYYFEKDGLVAKPIETFEEMIKEGKELHHCVAANYSKSYAEGKTNIFVIRKKDEIDAPFYTMEWKGKEIIQVRGNHNMDATEEVKRFVENFKKEKIEKKIKKIA